MSAAARSTLAVVCDVGPAYGVGHLMRCLALAEEFSARGFAVVFVADVGSVPFAARQVDARGFARLAPERLPETVEEHLSVLRGLRADVVVIDSYHLPVELYAACRAEFATLALVDGDPEGRVAHVLVDQNIGAELDEWQLDAGSTRLAGLDYALMREEILDQRPISPGHEEVQPPRVLAFFGGTDPFGAGPVVTRSLVRTRRRFSLTVVAPEAWPDPVATGQGQHVELIAPSENLAERVRAADLVVSAAGTSVWELLCLGAAACVVCLAPNQERAYDRMVADGLVTGVGHLEALRDDDAPATRALTAALDDPDARARRRAAGWQRVDGEGRRRVVDTFLSTAARLPR